jgi:D-alanyl-D-alanine carboxypeptidase/D-alanyl-D-alanine-endopeptidase (penicillin-binding protein 4)
VLELADGSGLSPDNRVSCALLVGLLERAGPDSAFASWLARPGQAGTLHDRMVGDELRDRVRAKTGSLNNVRSLSGWLTPRSGQPVAFAAVLNTAGPGADRGEEILAEQLLRSELGFPEVPGLGDLAPRAPRPA